MGPPPELVQITSDAVIAEHCEKKSLCVIAFLPHILDCQSSCRNKYLDMMKKMGDSFKKQGWGWLWSEGAAQLDLEESLGIGGFGYPNGRCQPQENEIFQTHGIVRT